MYRRRYNRGGNRQEVENAMSSLDIFRYCPCCGSSIYISNSFKSKKCEDCGFEQFLNPSAAYVALIRDTEGRLLVTRRLYEPAKGTLDLPGGFADMGETAEEGVAREVKEETNLIVTSCRFLFSLPNTYLYSGLNVPTLDLFFECKVADTSQLKAMDDAAECMWLEPKDINPDEFGLKSISEGIKKVFNCQSIT